MKKFIMTAFIVASLMQQTIALNSQDVTLNGSYLGIYNAFSGTELSSQFDFAANIDIIFKLSDKITGIAQLQSGVGNGSLGFVGPQAAVTDLNIVYQANNTNITTLGSFDLPLGDGTYYLTNNADATKSSFLLNSLTYSALSGPVGTLNTVGVKHDKRFSQINTTIALTNGTAEDAANKQNTMLYLIGLNKMFKKLYLGATYSASDDRADVGNTLTNSFDTDFSAWLVDVNYNFHQKLSFKGHIGNFVYNDHNASTTDKVQVLSAELSFKYDKTRIAYRVSSWIPDNNSGPYSPDLIQPGFSVSEPAGSSIIRSQLGFTRHLENNLSARVDIIYDNYTTATDITGVIAAINGSF